MVNWTGEIHEYMHLAQSRNLVGEPLNGSGPAPIDMSSQYAWHAAMTAYVRHWVEEHKDGRQDTWTPDGRMARDANGVWQ
jgi:hypothetical protein